MESISPIHGKVKCVHSYSFYKRVASIEMVVKSRQMSHQNPYCSVPTLDLYCPKHFYTFRFHDDQHNDRSLYALLYIFIWNFSSKHSLTVAQFYCKPSVCSCTYWAAIKMYKAKRLFEKVSLNSVRLVACTITIPLLLELFGFVVVVFFISFILFIHFSFDIFRYDNVENK